MWTPDSSVVTLAWMDASTASTLPWADASIASAGAWTDFSTASTASWSVPVGSPTTLGLQLCPPLLPSDAGDGSARYAYMVNDNAPIYLNDAFPLHIVDGTRVP